nr:MAG TPA: hypothetical protein [Caudoviricetes sp.]
MYAQRHAHGFCFSDDSEEVTGFVRDGRCTYIYINPDSYEPLAQVHNRTNMVINTL